jgi:hypothetical protein
MSEDITEIIIDSNNIIITSYQNEIRIHIDHIKQQDMIIRCLIFLNMLFSISIVYLLILYVGSSG